MQHGLLHPRIDLPPWKILWSHHKPPTILRRHMTELYEDDATHLAGRRVMRLRRITHVAARRIVAILIRESAFQNQKLFPTLMNVPWKCRSRAVANNTGCER